MDKNIIMVRGLGFDYGDGWVFHKLDLDIAQGDFVAVIGANGAGKSTTMKLILDILHKDSGSITILGPCHASHCRRDLLLW